MSINLLLCVAYKIYQISNQQNKELTQLYLINKKMKRISNQKVIKDTQRPAYVSTIASTLIKGWIVIVNEKINLTSKYIL